MQGIFVVITVVGKTSIITRYVTGRFDMFIAPTCGASFFTCKLTVKNTDVKLQVRSNRILSSPYFPYLCLTYNLIIVDYVRMFVELEKQELKQKYQVYE